LYTAVDQLDKRAAAHHVLLRMLELELDLVLKLLLLVLLLGMTLVLIEQLNKH
jgi:hypothetical protein